MFINIFWTINIQCRMHSTEQFLKPRKEKSPEQFILWGFCILHLLAFKEKVFSSRLFIERLGLIPIIIKSFRFDWLFFKWPWRIQGGLCDLSQLMPPYTSRSLQSYFYASSINDIFYDIYTHWFLNCIENLLIPPDCSIDIVTCGENFWK